MLRFETLYHPRVVTEDIRRLDPSTRDRIRSAVERKLGEHPERFAKPLAYTRAGLWSLRVGPWRVVFALRSEQIWVLRIGHRSEVYRRLGDRSVPDGRDGE